MESQSSVRPILSVPPFLSEGFTTLVFASLYATLAPEVVPPPPPPSFPPPQAARTRLNAADATTAPIMRCLFMDTSLYYRWSVWVVNTARIIALVDRGRHGARRRAG